MEKLITKLTLLGVVCIALLGCAKEPELNLLSKDSLKMQKDIATRPVQFKLIRSWNTKYKLKFDTGRIYVKRILMDSTVVYDTYTKLDFKDNDPVIHTSIPVGVDTIKLKIEIDDSVSIFMGKVSDNPNHMISYNFTQIKELYFEGILSGNDTIKITFDPQGWYMRTYTPFKLWQDRARNFNYGTYPGVEPYIVCSHWSYYQLGGPWRKVTAQETRKIQRTIE